MSNPCILTDNTVQFSQSQFQGKHLIQVLPLDIAFQGKYFSGGRDLKPSEMPVYCRDEFQPKIIVPTVSDLAALFLDLSQKHNEITCIFHSHSLSPLVERAIAAAETVKGRTHIEIIDSQTTSCGLGMIVQSAAEFYFRHLPATEVECETRGIVSHVFSIFCIPGMSYLHQAGFVDEGQAGASELLGLMPIFAMENGQLTPMEKLRSQRQTVDYFQEYLEEFDQLRQIAWVKGITSTNHDSRLMHDHAMNTFPQVPYNELAIQPHTATLFGPTAVSLFIQESTR